jgi:acetyltransferase-like isoleucine patch superfamily enzyme
MNPLTFLLRGMDRFVSGLRTRAAREVAVLAPTTRLTHSGRVDNILGRRTAITIGQNCVISGHLLVYAHAGSIQIGDWVFIGTGTSIWSSANITIGNRVLISHNVNILDNNAHPMDAKARFAQSKAILSTGHPRTDPGIESAPVRICDDAWISYGASILRGVTIGEGAIVGAASVVTRDVEPWTVVAGNPARVIRRLDQPADRRPV